MVGGRFNKEENLHMRLVLGGHEMRSRHPPVRILKVYTEALTGFSHIYCPDGLSNTWLSQGCVLETALAVGMMGRVDRGGGEKAWISWFRLAGQLAVTSSFFFLKEALKNIFIYLFLEGKGRRKRGREEEKH